MSYLVLARKYRPQSFDAVIGQDHITSKLKTAIQNNKVAHAYLFSGPRGVGKTTCARILAKELNSVKAEAASFDLDGNMDIIEIDGASNRGIDEIRQLRESVQFVPMSGMYKIYIVDEVHMLTGEAFNALLKTLEEPPAHVKFIFATTDPQKVPATVLSRCQRCDFKRIPLELMVNGLKAVCTAESIKADEDALFAVARASQGSMRDGLSILDQLGASANARITLKDVADMLGLVETEYLFKVTEGVAGKDASKVLRELDQMINQGKDAKELTRDMIEHFRNLMVMKVGGKDLESLIDYSKIYKEMLFTQSGKLAMRDIMCGMDALVASQDMARITGSSRVALELALVRMTQEGQPAVTAAPQAIVRQVTAPVQIKPVISPAAVSPKPLASPSPIKILSNNKGAIDLSLPSPMPAMAGVVALDEIRRMWHELTFAVSQKKISVGTYLQEGRPLNIAGDLLTIAFDPAQAFHKECLDTHESLDIISKVLSQALNTTLRVQLLIVENMAQDKAEAVDDALNMFQAEVVNEWHSDE
ncbi:MAG: DNA polymerase III subunit gamma/tau [Candidatus Omnitrophica bacterium]|nr:DNA polymerase III subunit gamma/tau [Candidatus Omnitrophota bacterium]